jgi:hypothetical protein
MSKKQFEESLNYGDSSNLFCFFGDVLKSFIDIDKKD